MKRIVRKKRPRTGVPPPDEAAAAAAKTDTNEFEEQLLLRLPVDVAQRVNELISDESSNLHKKFFISFDQDLRHANVTFENKQLYGRVVDLPTIIESLKTFDRSTMYKSCDIGQMIVAQEEPWPTVPDEIKATFKSSFPAHRDDKYTRIFAYKHGVTPPLKNVRRRRFRKTLVKKTFDVEDVERELARLFAADSEAAQVRWEVIEEDDSQKSHHHHHHHHKKKDDNNDEDEELEDGQESQDGTSGPTVSRTTGAPISARHLFGDDLSSSSDGSSGSSSSSDDDEDKEEGDLGHVPEHFDEESTRGEDGAPGSIAAAEPASPGSNSAFPSSPGGELSQSGMDSG